jgi:DNA-binding response OmpR family regulator
MRILVIEDEKKVADFIARGLRASAMVVDVAHEGFEGLSLALAVQYDLVLLDLMLPGLSGSDVLRKLRESGSQVAIIVLTARDETDEKVLNFELGADDYLTKPFAFEELLVRIKAVLRRPRSVLAQVLRLEDLELNRLTQRVTRAGKQIRLTGKEYGLLEYLMSQAGRTLTRTMIIDHVWDQSFEGLTNIVDVYVRHLRSKIDDPHPRKLIRTVRGMGYSIGSPDE